MNQITKASTHESSTENLEWTQSGMAVIGIFPGRTANSRPYAAICRMTKNGHIVSQLNHVPLSERAKEYLEIKGKLTPTIDGYNKINNFAGINFTTPDTIYNDEGKLVGNPAFEHTPRGQLTTVKIRMLGIGRKPTGNWSVIDYTLRFDLRTYFARDVMSKWRGARGKTAPCDWGTLYDQEKIPVEVENDPKIKIVYLPEAAIALNLDHADVRQLIAEHTERHQMAERLARSFVQRNIIRHFTGIHFLEAPDDPAHPIMARVVSWTQLDRDMEDLMVIAKGARGGRMMIDNKPVDVETSSGEVGEDDDAHIVVEDENSSAFNPDEMASKKEPDRESDMPPLSEVAASEESEAAIVDAQREKLSALIKSFGSNRLEVDAILKKYKINKESWPEYRSLSGIDAAIQEINEISVVKPGKGTTQKKGRK